MRLLSDDHWNHPKREVRINVDSGLGASASSWTNQAMELYHGTVESNVPLILAGIDVQQGRGRADFGLGFYTTTRIDQAWLLAQSRAELRSGSTPALLCFDVSRDALADLRCLWFIRGDAGANDFWNFVSHCRQGGTYAAGSWYDVVAGPVALERNTRTRASKR